MTAMPPPRPPGTRRLLCVANYPTNTGFAWDFIESVYAGLATRLAPRGVETWVAYPRVDEAPRPLAGSPARWFEFSLSLRHRTGRREARALVKTAAFDTVYLADRASWDPAYAGLRRAGLQHIVVHDHTSGARTRPRGVKRLLKRARHALGPAAMADRVLAVSDFVAERKRLVEVLPADRVERVWNSVAVPDRVFDAGERAAVRARFGIAQDRPLVVCACRSHPKKGVAELMRAFDRLLRSGVRDAGGRGPVLLYLGDGPAMPSLKALHDTLLHRDHMILAGYVADAAEVVGAADIAVVPSLWAEAFGLAALEPLARGVPVVASAVGGIPEVVRDGQEGLLVPPGDETALAAALARLLRDDAERRAMGERGHRRARETFDREAQLDRLEEIFVQEMGL